jgi:hypothetical protein
MSNLLHYTFLVDTILNFKYHFFIGQMPDSMEAIPVEPTSEGKQTNPRKTNPAVGAGPTSPTPPAYVHLPRQLWPTVNIRIPREYQQLAPGQSLVVPLILTLGLSDPTEQ